MDEISEYLKLKFIDQKYLKGSINKADRVTVLSNSSGENSFQYTIKTNNINILQCNYILHSEVLAKSYIQRFRDRMMFYVNMRDYSSKNYIAIKCEEGSNFSSLISGLEDSRLIRSQKTNSPDGGALFRKFEQSEIREELKSVFSWHILTTSTSIIPVKLFSKLGICPFTPSTHLKGRSMLQHLCFSCESVTPLQRMLDHFAESLDPLDFVEKLNTPSEISMNTAAHYAVFGGHFRNFEILMHHETDIWKPNFRGIRPFDVFSRLQQIGYDFRKIEVFNVVSVRDRLKNYYMNNILFGCKV